MNHSFKSVFNRRTGTWQVNSEKTRNAGKTGRSISKPLLAMLLGLHAGAGMAQTSLIDGGDTETITATTGTWNVGSNLTVGNFGTGTLIVESGGKVTSIEGYIGSGTGSNGTATVTGLGSVWQNSSTLYVGNRSTGTIHLNGNSNARPTYKCETFLYSAAIFSQNINVSGEGHP